MMDPETKQSVESPMTAPDLGKFASRTWWTQILTDFPAHFGVTANSLYDLETSVSEGMISWFEENGEVLKAKPTAPDVAGAG